MSISNLRVFARNLVYLTQDLKDAFWPGQLVDALRGADFARNALNDFEAEHDGIEGYQRLLEKRYPNPLASGAASATEAPPSVDASDRPAGDHPPSPAGHSTVPATVTRVVLVHEGGFTEKWAESWDLHVQDDGRTLKLFPRNQTAPRYEQTPGFFDIAPPR